jgi:hypothetical protein
MPILHSRELDRLHSEIIAADDHGRMILGILIRYETLRLLQTLAEGGH